MARIIRTDTHNISNIEILLSNYRILDSSWKAENIVDSFSRLYFIKSGNGWIKHNGKTVKLEGGRVYFIPSGITFSYGCTKLEKIFFHITVKGFESTDILSLLNDVYSLPFSPEEFNILRKHTESNDYISAIKLKGQLYSTISSFFEIYYKGEPLICNYSPTVKNVITYIQNNLSISLTSADIAKNLFLSQTKIRTDFKKETGVTIGKYIDDLIFSKICEMLITENYTIIEISRKFGFCDQYYLSRRFKEKYNISPTEYRKSALRKKDV